MLATPPFSEGSPDQRPNSHNPVTEFTPDTDGVVRGKKEPLQTDGIQRRKVTRKSMGYPAGTCCWICARHKKHSIFHVFPVFFMYMTMVDYALWLLGFQ
ncbi:MAG: hypothetical protein HQL52_16980 [Magnetococcales bacterium]|nr:hypothetical protein [Magnetococcales bacterium]